jgi:hypothetical protein
VWALFDGVFMQAPDADIRRILPPARALT